MLYAYRTPLHKCTKVSQILLKYIQRLDNTYYVRMYSVECCHAAAQNPKSIWKVPENGKEYQISRAHSFPRQNLTNSAANLVNSAAHRGKADEIPRLTAATQLNFRDLIKS